MRQIVSQMRRCVEDYRMIESGDRVAVGVSGGKDSVVTLAALAKLREFYPKHFTVECVTLDMGTPGMDFSPIQELCQRLEVPFHLIPSQIHQVIFEHRKEKNPCSLCAKMRRGGHPQRPPGPGHYQDRPRPPLGRRHRDLFHVPHL